MAIWTLVMPLEFFFTKRSVNFYSNFEKIGSSPKPSHGEWMLNKQGSVCVINKQAWRSTARGKKEPGTMDKAVEPLSMPWGCCWSDASFVGKADKFGCWEVEAVSCLWCSPRDTKWKAQRKQPTSNSWYLIFITSFKKIFLLKIFLIHYGRLPAETRFIPKAVNWVRFNRPKNPQGFHFSCMFSLSKSIKAPLIIYMKFQHT